MRLLGPTTKGTEEERTRCNYGTGPQSSDDDDMIMRIHFFISLMNKEKEFGLSPLPWDTLLPCATSPTDAQTDGKFPFACIRLGFRARKIHKRVVTTMKTI